MPSKEIAVLGLGAFGSSVVEKLSENNVPVLAIDKHADCVNKFSAIASHAVVADTTDEDALRQLGITNFDHVIVAIGQDIHASVLTTLILRDLGVRNIIVKVSDESHKRIIKRIGADTIVFPDHDMANRVAMSVMFDSVVDFLSLSADYTMAQLKVEKSTLTEKSLVELKVRSKYNIIIAAIRRDEDVIIPTAEDKIEIGDILVVIGNVRAVTKFTNII